MSITIDRPPVAAPPARTGGRDRPLLTLRLSDGYTWAHEFGASTPHDLREGAFEAFVACRLEWQRRADALPTYQTIKRANGLARMPLALDLHVLDNCTSIHSWVNANYGTDSTRKIVVRSPGTATNAEAWDEAEWDKYWLHCLRAWWGCAELNKFISSVVRDLDLEGRIAAEIARIAGGARGPDDGALT